VLQTATALFTGLIEDTGILESVASDGGGLRWIVRPQAIPLSELSLGESVAIDGVCLTIAKLHPTGFEVVLGAETLAASVAKDSLQGSEVNLERAMKLGDRLGGHLVQGHVDGRGVIKSKKAGGQNVDIEIETERPILVIAKGSIAVDGISLTVNRVLPNGFSVALIPHTLDHTTLGKKQPGQRVNLEADMIGKYVEVLHAKSPRP
jgi:riboflavin synthase